MGKKKESTSRDLEQLADALGKNQFDRRLGKSRLTYRQLIVATSLVLVALIAYFSVTLYRNRDLSEEALERYAARYVATEASDFDFKWTEKSVNKLVAKDSQKGTLLADIYRKYGKATKAELIKEEAKSDGFKLIYETNHFDLQIPYQSVTLSFKKRNGKFRLFEKEASLELTTYKSDWGHVFDIEKSDLSDLKTGYIGIDPEKYPTAASLYKKFGKPNKIVYESYGGAEDMHWYYYHPEADEWNLDDYVIFYFQKHPGDKDFHLSVVTTVFDGEEMHR
ncbi:hypothetical protein [Streptococcus pluranimalium]|uniref:Uncharacterized protein n=1 Tax=Streptococcus pluranimalium TaxID=82348 RepID=A0A345VHF0_9STRE|nr:hypothetical protein [Streptococcus pluranimalium]AXJ12152.1 hypothetical protein Sp14A_01980 [Streptococcus pluranimalium]